jgi:hypothetical protein
VLCADVVVAEAPGFVHGELDDFLGAGGEADLTHDGSIAATDDELNGGAYLVQFDAEVREDFGGYALAFSYQAQEEMFGPYVVVVEAQGFFLR